jgi:azurin
MDNDTLDQNPDAPLKAFATFFIGLAAFAAVGMLAFVVFKASDSAEDAVYEQDMERRSGIREKVDADQATEMASYKIDLAAAATALAGHKEVASQKPAAGTPAAQALMEKVMAEAKAKKDAEDAAKKAAEPAPAEGTGEPTTPAVVAQEITVVPVPNVMQYATKELKAKAGVPIKLTFNNTDVLMHNLLVLKPGTMDKVGALADAMIADPQGMVKGYIPESDDIISHTKLLMSTQEETIEFTLEAGVYPFICTFPGHWRIMNGTLTIE